MAPENTKPKGNDSFIHMYTFRDPLIGNKPQAVEFVNIYI